MKAKVAKDDENRRGPESWRIPWLRGRCVAGVIFGLTGVSDVKNFWVHLNETQIVLIRYGPRAGSANRSNSPTFVPRFNPAAFPDL
jgi:hypothetical protein